MTVAEAVAGRGVTELLHYTTQKGVLGTIASGAILSRAQLDGEEYLAHIREAVWPRKDPAWIDHISLSMTSINYELFLQSRSHYPELWWAVFSVSSAILEGSDAVFTTTNNIFPSVRRGRGLAGFEAMFAEEVVGKYGAIHTRAGLADNQPSDRAAEVLYPVRIAMDAIQGVYVIEPDHRNMILAWCDAHDRPELSVEVRPDVFA